MMASINTITPIPPIHSMKLRHHWIVWGRRSARAAMVRPVPVYPETASKKALAGSLK